MNILSRAKTKTLKTAIWCSRVAGITFTKVVTKRSTKSRNTHSVNCASRQSIVCSLPVFPSLKSLKWPARRSNYLKKIFTKICLSTSVFFLPWMTPWGKIAKMDLHRIWQTHAILSKSLLNLWWSTFWVPQSSARIIMADFMRRNSLKFTKTFYTVWEYFKRERKVAC
jgi:hypothetical protein